MIGMLSSSLMQSEIIICGLVRKRVKLLDHIYIRFGSKLYRHIVGIPMGTNCAPLVADLFLFCYERAFMLSLPGANQSEVIEVFNSTSRYLDDVLNIHNNFYDIMDNHIYLQNSRTDIEASFLDLHVSTSYGLLRLKFMTNDMTLILML